MSVNGVLKLSKYKEIFAIISCVMIGIFHSQPAHAINGGDVIHKMSPEARVSYITGLVEAFGYARFRKDKPSQDGMKCIIDWYYKGGDATKLQIKTWFDKHADKPASVLLFTLIKRKCGT